MPNLYKPKQKITNSGRIAAFLMLLAGCYTVLCFLRFLIELKG